MKEILMDILVYVAVGMGTAVLAYAVKVGYSAASAWLVKKEAEAAAADNELQASAFKLANSVLANVTQVVVGRIEQTKAADIREKVKTGQLEYKQLEILATDAYYDILDQLKPEVMASLEGYVTDMESYIYDQIEATLAQIKVDLYGKVSGSVEEETSGRPIGFAATAAE